MKSSAEAAPRGTSGRRTAVPIPDVAADRESEATPESSASWPVRAGNQAVVDFVRSHAGHSMPPIARAILERHLGDRFDDVRLHTGPEAADVARRLDARALTYGRHVLFDDGEYAPDTDRGLRLLAHELMHVRQQRVGEHADGTHAPSLLPPNHATEKESQAAARALTDAHERPITGGNARQKSALPVSAVHGPAIQRQPRRAPIAEFDVDNEFTTQALVSYLDALQQRGAIEGKNDSDDKCRAIVKQWVEGGSPFFISALRAKLMILEMQDGFTGDDDERAILELLWRSNNDDLREIFGPGGVTVDELNGDFHWQEFDWLKLFYDQRIPGARRDPPVINPRGEPIPLGTPLPVYAPRPARAQQQTRADQDPQQPRGDRMHPEWCATYEEWISFFPALTTYTSPTGHQVLGPTTGGAPAATATDLNAPLEERRPPVLEPREAYLPTDRFIDGPTERWVRDNLPANLVEVAYQLPSDCADIAVILRHVWLAAHNREEMYNGWLCGSRRGTTRRRDMNQLLLDEVWTGSVAGIVSPYADASGNRLLTWNQLEPLLHPGDILVWKHPGRGGHTHTVEQIQRDAQGHITSMTGLQGNQPISETRAAQLRQEDLEVQRQRPRRQRQATPTQDDLQKAAGRRIERGTVQLTTARANPNDTWRWADGTWLVAAGPPAAAPRPRPPRGQNRALSDWLPEINGATLDNLDSRFESALLEVRTFLELGTPPTADDVAALGAAAGAKLLALARDAGDLQQGGTHVYRVQRMSAQIRWYGSHVNRNNQPVLWQNLERTFVDAARGISSVSFSRLPNAGLQQVDVLVTGFDPFNTAAARTQPPRPGDWNPSAAAARQLDGETLPVEGNVRAAVEGVVFPVSFKEFKGGIVERVIDAHPNVNAVITVSLDASINPNGPVDLEQYAVGMHQLNNGERERVPAAAGGKTGPLIEDATAPLNEIARETDQGGRATDTLAQRPTTDFTLKLEFENETTAARALTALGVPAQRSAEVEISDESAVRTIRRTMRREIGQGSRISFTAGGRVFVAEIVGGPGGDYLSNEVSYRALRRLQERERQGGTEGVSFHVHTPGAVRGGAEPLPAPDDARRADAESKARTVTTRLVNTLRRIIISVARRIARRRGPAKP